MRTVVPPKGLSMSTSHFPGRLPLRALYLALAAACAPAAFAQSTTGSLFGDVPAAPGTTVRVENQSGVSRDLPVDASGRYKSPALPIGTYTVTLLRDGKVLDTRDNVAVRVGNASEVSFSAGTAQAATLDGVQVSANATPPIDVASVDSRTVIDAQQLAKLPLGRTAEQIAQLAPGVVPNSGGFTSDTGKSLVSFGGSSANANAYYINGFNTTDPLQALGGITLPYGAIDQEEVYTGGYSAQYGRSDGGVINAVGKRGTDTWHYGVQFLWEPQFARAKGANNYYASGVPQSAKAGNLYAYNRDNRNVDSTASVYAGGPLIKDKLYVFAAAEVERRDTQTVANEEASNSFEKSRSTMPRWYTKLDWNITDSNILELTGASDKTENRGSYYDYDYVAKRRGAFVNDADRQKNGGDLWSGKFTSYITDALTLTAEYGKMHTQAYQAPANYDGSLTYIDGDVNQNPALNGGVPIGNAQTTDGLSDPKRGNFTTNTRLDLAYAIGDHTISVGIDNLTAKAANQGSESSGPGYTWSYSQSLPNVPINSDLGVGATGDFPNGADGYFVQKNTYSQIATVRSTQRAQYVEDKWQVNDRLLLQLGLRNDQFTNYDSASQAYITQTKPQWAPRLGFSWDVMGDASFKVYGNAGRYYLGLPLNPALNSAAATTNTVQYYTYGGIAADGTPTGLTPMSGPVSGLNLYGQQPDPKVTTAKGLTAEKQDEYILGFTKTAGPEWVYGAKLMYRNLRNAIDDYCDRNAVLAKSAQLGQDASTSNSCFLINPGRANTFTLVDASGNYVEVPMSNAELGFPKLKRQYYSLETLLEHPFDGRWYAKFDYVFSRSYGNTEGQLRSDVSQANASTSYDWDGASIMQFANGPQNNDHTHQIKLYGYYQIDPEWLVSANLAIISGSPRHCLGFYGADGTDPLSYGSLYHFCNGEPSRPGKQGHLPWTRQLDIGATYSPAFADHKLSFSANIFNLMNEQRPLQLSPYSELSPQLTNPLYRTVTIRQQPRYARLSVSYDF